MFVPAKDRSDHPPSQALRYISPPQILRILIGCGMASAHAVGACEILQGHGPPRAKQTARRCSVVIVVRPYMCIKSQPATASSARYDRPPVHPATDINALEHNLRQITAHGRVLRSNFEAPK